MFLSQIKIAFSYDCNHKNLIYLFVHLFKTLNTQNINKLSILAFVFSFTFFASCGGDKSKTEQDASKPVTEETDATASDPSSYDPNRGEGKYDSV